MRRPSVVRSAVFGGITSIPLIALLYLGQAYADLPFVPFDFFDWLARVLPGDIVTLGIDTLVTLIVASGAGSTSEAAKTMEQVMALILFVAIGLGVGAVIAVSARRRELPAAQIGAVVGAVLLGFVLVVEAGLTDVTVGLLGLVWLGLLFIGWGALLGYLQAPATSLGAQADTAPDTTRRDMLRKVVGGSAAIALGAWGLGRMLSEQQQVSGAGQPLANVSTATPLSEQRATPAPSATAADAGTATTPTPDATAVSDATATATMRDRVAPAPGTRPELTSNEDFYRIDINTRPVVIDGDSWVLQVEGLFDNVRPLTLEDMMAYPAVTQPITLSCISNRIGGDLIGTSNWTGVRMRDILKDLGMRPEAQELYIEAADGFYESVVMEDLMDPRTLLVYGMNGETLPVEHGFPLRIYIPNRYGMKQPKWITRIEAIDEEGPGYWVERGWSEEARPQIISMIDTVATDDAVDGTVPVGGIAWAGDRGIQRVEVQVDDGEWNEAVLRTPPLSQLTWVQWRWDWPATSGIHRLRVRATDGTGALQIEEESGVRPDGATGYHAVQARV